MKGWIAANFCMQTLPARVVLGDCVRELVQSGRWIGATLVCEAPPA